MDRERPRKKHYFQDTVNKIIIFFIVLLFIVAAFLGGYYAAGSEDFTIVLKELISCKKETTDNSDGTDTNEVNLKDSYVANLLPNVLKGFDCWALEEFATDRRVTANDISSRRAYAIVEANSYYYSDRESIPLTEYMREAEKYLGTSYKFDPEEITNMDEYCPQFEYQKDNQKFVRRAQACSNKCGNSKSYYKIVDVKKEKKNIVFVVKVLFADRDGKRYYSDYDKTKFVTEDRASFETTVGQGGEYKFTFKEENGNYIFASSEPVE
jgi:hypothetical protein